MRLIKESVEWFDLPQGWELASVHLVEDKGLLRKFRSLNLWEQPDSNPKPNDIRYYNTTYWAEVYDQETHYKTHDDAYKGYLNENDLCDDGCGCDYCKQNENHYYDMIDEINARRDELEHYN